MHAMGGYFPRKISLYVFLKLLSLDILVSACSNELKEKLIRRYRYLAQRCFE